MPWKPQGDSAPTAGRPLRVTLITEGTYPFVVGGVSTWCQDLIKGLGDVHWDIIPITAGGVARQPLFELPPNSTLHQGIELWGPTRIRALPRSRRGSMARRSARELPARLARLLLRPDLHADELAEILCRCQLDPSLADRGFRSAQSWPAFALAVRTATQEVGDHLFEPVPVTTLDAAYLWQTLYWLARTASVEIPPSDVILCTAAGWPAVIASVAKRQRGTPVVVAEHGVYVREAYLESVRNNATPGHDFASTRLATGLARLAYAIADRITPVCAGHHPWQEILGAPLDRIDTIVNGVDVPGTIAPPVTEKLVVSVGRIDPLKDIGTALRVARVVCDMDDEVRFLHYGPVTPVNESYYAMCLRLHHRLGLGDRFVFMGGTRDPRGAMRQGAVYLSTSISEGLPLSVLEAMTEARPVVATDVGGCADLVRGCGVLAPSGDVMGIAGGVKSLLDNPELAAAIGRRGFRRAERRFSRDLQLTRYRDLLEAMAVAPVRRAPVRVGSAS
jgi:glycosyltransferase involved in cell wall biosynthesis